MLKTKGIRVTVMQREEIIEFFKLQIVLETKIFCEFFALESSKKTFLLLNISKYYYSTLPSVFNIKMMIVVIEIVKYLFLLLSDFFYNDSWLHFEKAHYNAPAWRARNYLEPNSSDSAYVIISWTIHKVSHIHSVLLPKNKIRKSQLLVQFLFYSKFCENENSYLRWRAWEVTKYQLWGIEEQR